MSNLFNEANNIIKEQAIKELVELTLGIYNEAMAQGLDKDQVLEYATDVITVLLI